MFTCTEYARSLVRVVAAHSRTFTAAVVEPNVIKLGVTKQWWREANKPVGGNNTQ